MPDRSSSREDIVSRFIDLASDIEVAMLTTVSSDHSLHSRPMLTLKPITLQELWFFTRADSTKAEEIERQRQVALTFSNPVRHRYVAVSGQAAILRDDQKARELWVPIAALWFPGGPEDTHLRLLRVNPRTIEYWDAEEKRMKVLFDAARAAFGAPTPPPANEPTRIEL